MKSFVIPLIVSLGVSVLLLGLAITFGGPKPVAALDSISEPFKNLDYSELPEVSFFNARDGQALAYRFYPPTFSSAVKAQVKTEAQIESRGSVVLVHGSSASSQSMHQLAMAFASAGFSAYSLDIRGHGESGKSGDITYLGQLEHDLEDFVSEVKLQGSKSLVGFSSGGGFALRFAGSDRQVLFDNYLLLSPFISQDSPTSRNNGSGGWVSVGVPRLVAISILDAMGLKLFNHLPVIRFALRETSKVKLTHSYSYLLATNFRPKADYNANIAAIKQPLSVLVGDRDELFNPKAFTGLFETTNAKVNIIQGVNHVGMILSPNALDKAVTQLAALVETDSAKRLESK
ncbi:alpha/beta hydrolase fold [Shewanella denitrificans OS217]|jgi:alpha-beta hydrolase superfamily lysophospholipase|uniref:Alpha/beta hydrolase fold n=1 Tax=Shewanella denitrificans (strain OS217 / ATCC BAA-1090 / DSM 15013) TaxID=318161 RepID=Q12PX8_SHEDO|nr:alpha/beta fold hydrolase [Shewanella denitrificans]ABE54498.1 alpha/beta hydrolase fold [Shewanella denitrificans OS217]